MVVCSCVSVISVCRCASAIVCSSVSVIVVYLLVFVIVVCVLCVLCASILAGSMNPVVL
jgi:hypothetical protein